MNTLEFNLKLIFRNKTPRIQLINLLLIYVIAFILIEKVEFKKPFIYEYMAVFISGMSGFLLSSFIFYLPKTFKNISSIYEINMVKITGVYLLFLYGLNLLFLLTLFILLLKSSYLFSLANLTLNTTILIAVAGGYFNKFSPSLNSIYNKHINYSGVAILIPLFGNKIIIDIHSQLYSHSDLSILFLCAGGIIYFLINIFTLRLLVKKILHHSG